MKAVTLTLYIVVGKMVRNRRCLTMNERAEYWHKKMQERLKKMNPEQRYNYELSKKLWVEFYRRMNKEYLSPDEIQKYLEKEKEYKYWKGNGKGWVK